MTDSPPAPGPLAAPPSPTAGPGGGAQASKIVRLALAFYGIATLFAIGFSLFSGKSDVLFGETWPSGAAWLAGILLGLAIVGLCRLAHANLRSARRAADALSDLLGPLSYRDAIWLALISGTVEELLFRGALWPTLGLFGTTLLFGVVHVLPRRALLGYPLFAIVAGLLLGLVRQWGGNVLPSMVAHAVVNGVNLVWLERRRRKGERAAP